MSASFDIEIIKRKRDTVRAAKLALLKIQAQQTAEHTDASARKVEEALARVTSAIAGELIILAISGIGADLRRSSDTD